MKNKKNKGNNSMSALIKLIIIVLIIVAVIFGIFKGIDKLKNKGANNNDNKNYDFVISEETKERIAKVKEEVKKREETIKRINSGSLNINDYKELAITDFMKKLQSEKLYLSTEGDEFIANVIRIKGEKIEVKDYKKDGDKAVETTENNSLADGKPQIMVTDKAIYDNDGNIVTKIGENGKVTFNGTKNGSDIIIEALDKEDRYLTNKVEVEYSKPLEEWKSGEVYTVKYKVKDSDNNEAIKEVKVKVLDANSN